MTTEIRLSPKQSVAYPGTSSAIKAAVIFPYNIPRKFVILQAVETELLETFPSKKSFYENNEDEIFNRQAESRMQLSLITFIVYIDDNCK